MNGLQNIFHRQEQEDRHLLRYQKDAVIRQEYAGADRLLAKRRAGCCAPLPCPVLMRTAHAFSIRKHTEAQQFYFHCHDFYEIVYVQKGKHTQYIANCDTPVTLLSGEAILLPPGTVHAMQAVGTEDMVLKLVIPQEILSDLSFSALSLHLLEDGTAVEHLIWQLAEEYYFGKAQKQTRIQKYLRQLLTAFLCNQFRQDLLTSRLTTYIQEHLQTATLTAFAKYMGYSPRHIQRLLSDEGTIFSCLLRRLRLQKAAELLSTTSFSVEQIAQQTGFETAGGFYKSFQAQFCITPGQYRKIYSNKQ